MDAYLPAWMAVLPLFDSSLPTYCNNKVAECNILIISDRAGSELWVAGGR